MSRTVLLLSKVILVIACCFGLVRQAQAQNSVPFTGSNSITTCSGTIQDHAGSANYSPNANGYTVINPSVAGNNVSLTFTQFATESSYDL